VRRLILAIFVLFTACGGPGQDQGPVETRKSGGNRGNIVFSEIVLAATSPGIAGDWPDGTHAIIEITGTGIGLIDVDQDGDLDLLHVRHPPPGRPAAPAPNRLYLNDGSGTFHDGTEGSNLGHPGFGQGLAAGDPNGDGLTDIYVTNIGPDVLFLNRGGGRFEPAGAEWGIEGDHWSTAAVFCDYDGDGDHDLFVTHYVDYDPTAICLDDIGARDFCGPTRYDGVPDTLYRNDGGRFTDVSTAAGLTPADGGASAKGLGALCTDLTGDDVPDLYVTNDGEPNHFWIGTGDGRFSEEGMMRAVAVNRYGSPESSMGVAAGDMDNDGTLDLFMTHLVGQNNTLYAGRKGDLFADRTAGTSLADHDFGRTGFGCGFADFDHDGDLDLAVVNGRVYRGTEQVPGSLLGTFWNDYAEPNLLFENQGGGRFASINGNNEPFVQEVEVSRGLAFGDLDGDGDLDMVVSNNDQSLRLFRNESTTPDKNRWLAIRAMDGAVVALGAQVTLVASDVSRAGLLMASYSYLSSHQPLAHFGLGDWTPDSVVVGWMDGSRERFPIENLDQVLTVVKGDGERP